MGRPEKIEAYLTDMGHPFMDDDLASTLKDYVSRDMQQDDMKYLIDKLLMDYYQLSHRYLEQEQMIKMMTEQDVLTDVMNRPKIMEQIRHEWSRSVRYHSPSSLICFDVDDFKHINEKYGHDIGDRVLVKLTDVVRTNIRSTDVLGRVGADSFAIVVPTTNNEQAEWLCGKLQQVIDETRFIADESINVSFGVADREASMDPEDWFKIAEIAMKHGKEQGGHGIVDYERIQHTTE